LTYYYIPSVETESYYYTEYYSIVTNEASGSV